MQTDPDVRWKQRLRNYELAWSHLDAAVALSQQKSLSELERQGLIQSFEFTHELAWNVMKDYFFYQGTSTITGSRDASREAFQRGLVTNGEVWMEMIRSRNQTSHTYNKKVADEIVTKIQDQYLPALTEFKNKMKALADQGQ